MQTRLPGRTLFNGHPYIIFLSPTNIIISGFVRWCFRLRTQRDGCQVRQALHCNRSGKNLPSPGMLRGELAEVLVGDPTLATFLWLVVTWPVVRMLCRSIV